MAKLRADSETTPTTRKPKEVHSVRMFGQAQLGFFPLPTAEAKRLKNWLSFPAQFSALDPCIGDGVAFAALLEGATATRYGIEIDAHRSTQAKSLGMKISQANTLDFRCATESLSLIYLTPPYDWEYGQAKNRRLQVVFLEHTYRWLKHEGVLLFIIRQPQIKPCARLLAEHFRDIRIYKLTEPECVRYKRVAIVAVRRKRHDRLHDSALNEVTRYLEGLSIHDNLAALADLPEASYQVPASGPVLLTDTGIPLDLVEDLVLQSAAYRQAARGLIREQKDGGGRPLSPRRVWRRLTSSHCALAIGEVCGPLDGRGRRRHYGRP